MKPENFRDLMRLVHGFETAKIFLVANDLELFRWLGVERQPAELAAEVGVEARALELLMNALVALGEREQGLAWARMARDLDPGDPMLLYNLGCIHALAHDVDEALFLSDRVACMTDGPEAAVGDILAVNFQRPRERKVVVQVMGV